MVGIVAVGTVEDWASGIVAWRSDRNSGCDGQIEPSVGQSVHSLCHKLAQEDLSAHNKTQFMNQGQEKSVSSLVRNSYKVVLTWLLHALIVILWLLLRHVLVLMILLLSELLCMDLVLLLICKVLLLRLLLC